MKQFLVQRWFLLVLCLALVVGVTSGERLAPYAGAISKEALIALVMLATSLPIDFRRLASGRRNWVAVGLAILVNAAVAPPMGWLFGQLLPPTLTRGLVVAMAVPCTVATAIVWTRRGGGNDVATAMVTLTTNFGCFLVLPFWTGLLLSQSVETQPSELVIKLLAYVATPMLIAQLARLHPTVAAWADGAKVGISLAAQSGVLLMAFLGAIAAGVAMQANPGLLDAGDWAALAGVVVLLHLALLAIAWQLARAARLAPPETLTVLIGGSQKTMAVGIGVALYFGPLAIFPLIAYHFAQLLIDTLVVDWWRERYAATNQGEKTDGP